MYPQTSPPRPLIVLTTARVCLTCISLCPAPPLSLSLSLSPNPACADILVDPFFLDAFHQQPSTSTYDSLLASLPCAFVGTAPELKQLVALLTAQSIKAYLANVSVWTAALL